MRWAEKPLVSGGGDGRAWPWRNRQISLTPVVQVRPARLMDELSVALRRGVDPLDRARALQHLRTHLEDLEAEIVGDARKWWYSWSDIAAAFDRRKQTTWAKHHERHP